MKTKVYPIIGFLLIFCIVTFSSGCNFFKSDETKITDRINTFAKSFNSGNVDATVNCFDEKTKTIINSALGIGNVIIDDVTGYNITVQNVLGIVMGLTKIKNGDSLIIDSISNINISGSKANADVSITFIDNFSDKKTSTRLDVNVEFKKENDDWFISSIKQA